METRLITPDTLRLLHIDDERALTQKDTTRLVPAAIAVTNLFFSAYFEQFLRDDPSGHSLSLFLFIQGAVFLGIGAGYYLSRTEEILRKCRIFPTTPWSRFVFVAASNLRRPLCIALWSTNVFVLALLYRHSVAGLIGVPVFVTLYLLGIQAALALAFLAMTRAGYAVSGAAAVTSCVLFGILIGSVVFNVESLLSLVPLVSWTARGILATRTTEMAGLAIGLALAVAFIGIMAGAARRWA